MANSTPIRSVSLSIQGDLNQLTARPLDEELRFLASALRAPELVVWLHQVTGVDAAGLKPLVAAQELLERRGRRLRLRGVPRSMATAVRDAGLGASLNVADIAIGDQSETAGAAIPVQRA